MNDSAKQTAHPGQRSSSFKVPKPRYAKRWLRMAGAALAVAGLAILMAGGGLYFLFRGDAVGNSSLNSSIQSAVQRILGPGFVVDLGQTSVELKPDWLLSVSGKNVRVLRASDRQEVATLGRVVVGVEPISVLRGNPNVDAINIEDTELDAAVLFPGGSSGLPADLNVALSAIGQRLHKAVEQLGTTRFRLVNLTNVTVNGLILGRKEPGPLSIERMELRLRSAGALQVSGHIQTQFSSVRLDGGYKIVEPGRGKIDLSISDLSLREWLADHSDAKGFAGTDGTLAAKLEAELSDGALLGDPKITVDTTPATWRLGASSKTAVPALTFNIRILADKNQIELDPSIVEAGAFNARLIGGLRPVDDRAGFGGPLRFELIADPAVRKPTIAGETSISSSIQLLGNFDHAEKIFDISNIVILAGKDSIEGSALIGYSGETPSITGAARSDGLQVAALKQLWPMFIASPARNWAFPNLVGGRLSDIEFRARIPAGVIGRFRSGAKMAADEFALSADFSGARFDTLGDLPAIRNAAGHIAMSGMKFNARFTAGEAFLDNNQTISLTGGEFQVDDFAVRPAVAGIHVIAEGAASAFSLMSAAKPLEVPAKLGIDLSKLSGKATADVTFRLPLTKAETRRDLEWRARLELKDVSNANQIYGHQVAGADVTIEAQPGLARIKGEAIVDGIPATLDLVEALDKSGEKTERKIVLLFDDKVRAKLGMAVDPILTGSIKINVTQSGKKPELYSADLSEAVLDLPWIGWRKGKGIEGRATFRLKRSGTDARLDDLYVEGQGFSVAGAMAFNRSGLASADFADVSLNSGDSLSVKITRKGKGYTVVAEGARFDARGLINKLVHVGGFGAEQGNEDVLVSATIGSVKGFGDVTLQNVAMTYGTADGWFDNLSFRGSFSEKSYVSLVASTSSRRTVFDIDATNAGQAFKMTDFYRRMNGGRLQARLTRDAGGPFKGPVKISDFVLDGESLLKRLVTEPASASIDRDTNGVDLRRELNKVETDSVRFSEARAMIDKGNGYFRVSDGIGHNSRIGIAIDGIVYNSANRMDVAGTFMPGIGLNRAIGLIPIVGDILGNGRDTSLIGVNFRLSGAARDPVIEINPISIVTPGVFRKIFEFKN